MRDISHLLAGAVFAQLNKPTCYRTINISLRNALPVSSTIHQTRSPRYSRTRFV